MCENLIQDRTPPPLTSPDVKGFSPRGMGSSFAEKNNPIRPSKEQEEEAKKRGEEMWRDSEGRSTRLVDKSVEEIRIKKRGDNEIIDKHGRAVRVTIKDEE